VQRAFAAELIPRSLGRVEADQVQYLSHADQGSDGAIVEALHAASCNRVNREEEPVKVTVGPSISVVLEMVFPEMIGSPK
jgi:hypothetical protein